MTTTVTQDLLATLDAKQKALKAEIEEIKRLKAAIKAASGDAIKPIRKRTRSPSEGPTFKDMIKVVLKEKGEGADALEILERIETRFGKVIKRTSISPQLSRLKASGDLMLEDKIWMLPSQYDEVIARARNEALAAALMRHTGKTGDDLELATTNATIALSNIQKMGREDNSSPPKAMPGGWETGSSANTQGSFTDESSRLARALASKPHKNDASDL